jgi:hypothetical protein
MRGRLVPRRIGNCLLIANLYLPDPHRNLSIELI